MNRKVISVTTLTLLLTGMLTLVFNIQSARAGGTVYIRADGSIDPPTAPISSVDNITYTLTDNINESIVVERDNIIIDGAGYTLSYGGSSIGMEIDGRHHIVVRNINVSGIQDGIYVDYSHHILIKNNTLWNSRIYFYRASHNAILNNTILGPAPAVGVPDFRSLIYFDYCLRNNTVAKNTIMSYGSNGIIVDECGYIPYATETSVTVRENVFKTNDIGITLYKSASAVVFNNTITENEAAAVRVWSGRGDGLGNHTIMNNNMTDNRSGIYFELGTANNNTIIGNIMADGSNGIIFDPEGAVSHYNVIANNTLMNNARGIQYRSSASWNKVYHNNFINNTQHITISSAENAYDDGYPSGGNYYSDYNGTDLYKGPYQNHTGSDGIGDIPYILFTNHVSKQDNYPLMEPYGRRDVHDIGITRVKPSKASIVKDHNLNITVNVLNYGLYVETFSVTAYTNTTIIGTQEVTDLVPGAEVTLIFTWNTTGMALGNYTISASVSIVPNETDTADNTYIDGIVTVRLPFHDVAIADVMPSNTVVAQGFSLSINVTVENQGDYTETFNVTAYTNTTQIGKQTVTNLNSDADKILSFTWNTTSFAKGNYIISAYAHPVPGETDTIDNNLTDGWILVTIPGDVNDDRICDMADISMMIDAFMTELGDPKWNPNCDINCDGVVDMADISIAIDNFMKT